MRGMGRIFRMKGSKNLWIAYNCRGKEYRESCGSPELKEAKKLLKHRLRETGADVLALKAFVGPKQERLTIGQLLDALEADFRLREIKSLKQTKWHLNIVRAAFGHLRAVDLTTEMVTKYMEDRLAEGQAPATLNKRTGLLAAAFRLAVRRRQLSSRPEIPKLREDNARQGFFASEDFFTVLSNLEDQDLADFLQWFFWTGMRPGEIRSLTWQAFDSET